ncbi:hypothetical protein CRUP_004563 [Coryphaenoides rupestris]|nr:hypothetical protein CRUP_004563 [Coryphaenoides rupestris]
MPALDQPVCTVEWAELKVWRGGAGPGLECAESGVSFSDVVKHAMQPQLAVTPNPRAKEVYNQMLKRYAELEDRILQEADH